jgi:ATP-dependent RNA helicase RhlE
LPILQRLAESGRARQPKTTRALILAPTRELAIQVEESFKSYGRHLPLRSTCIFGGVGEQPQKVAMSRGVDILVATPGRLIDLLNQGAFTLSSLEVFVLDEADRMLDMGFIHDIRRVIKLLPANRHNLFFSATMPEDIAGLAGSILRNPARVEVTPVSTPVERITQRLHFVGKTAKHSLLRYIMLNDPSVSRVIVFSRTKHGANRIAENLEKVGVKAAAIHGNKSQNRRQEALQGFRDGTIRALVATDIAARGIDVDGITHVINFDLPDVPETYVHRIGRTARAGADGAAITFCSSEERDELKQVERLIKRAIPVAKNPEGFEEPMPEDMETRLRQNSGRSDKPRHEARKAPQTQGQRAPQGQSRGGQSSQGRGQGGDRPARSGDGRGQDNRAPQGQGGQNGRSGQSRQGQGEGQGSNNTQSGQARNRHRGRGYDGPATGRDSNAGSQGPTSAGDSMMDKVKSGFGRLFGR